MNVNIWHLLEQYIRKNSIRITGVPEKPNENLLDIIHQHVTARLPPDCSFDILHIDNLHRLGKPLPGRGRQIIVKFMSFQKKMIIMRNRKLLKGTGIIVSDDLTHKNYIHLNNLRDRYGAANAWSWGAKMYYKTDANASPQLVKSSH